jgi:hypothetical protein
MQVRSQTRRGELGPKRTSRFVIILSLAVFDRVKAEGLAVRVEPDARNAPDLAARPRLRVTRSEIAIHEFGRHRHHDQSKNPAHHTTGSKLAPRRAVLKFNLDAIYRSIMQTDGVSPDDIGGCSLSSLTASAVLARSSFPSSVCSARRLARLPLNLP